MGTSYHLPGAGGVSGGSYLTLITGNGRASLSVSCNYGFAGDTEAWWSAMDPAVVAGTVEITNVVDDYPMESFNDLQYNQGGQDRAFQTTSSQGPRPWHGLFTATDGGVLTQWDVIFTETPGGDCNAVVYASGAAPGTVVHP